MKREFKKKGSVVREIIEAIWNSPSISTGIDGETII
jgi:hypothetical protein